MKIKELNFIAISKTSILYGEDYQFMVRKWQTCEIRIAFRKDTVFIYIKNPNNEFIFYRAYGTFHIVGDNLTDVFERLVSQIDYDFNVLSNYDYRSICLSYFLRGYE